jgi:alkylhydroperoxidase family enzyme
MALTSYRTSPVFSDRDRAALGLAEAVARHREGEPAPGEQAIERARGLFTEPEIARITHTAAHEHFFNPETGAIGLDAAEAGFRHLGSGASPLTGAHR